jgi:hypothetical protein
MTDESRLALAFRLATSRQPQPDELQILAGMLTKMRDDYRASTKDALAVTGTDTADGVNANDLAAWTLVTRAILNLDETITRE